MDEPDCAGLTYDRPPPRDFANGDPAHCGGSTDDPQPFDDVVRADHARIAAGPGGVRGPIERAGGTFSADELAARSSCRRTARPLPRRGS